MSSHKHKKVIVIAGPTAVGKTGLAIRVASHFNTEIISADSRQCYREMNIGVARPSAEELKAIPHHFIASHSIHDEITAAGFETYALRKVDDLFQTHDVVVMVGGTGLYIRAFCDGLDNIPSIDPATRNHIVSMYESKGLEWLQQEVKARDPIYYETGEIQNPRRLMRALEVATTTGQSITSFRSGEKSNRDFTIIKTALQLPREILVEHINTRVDLMMQAGLLDEVRASLAYRHLNALQTVGYTELFDYLDGKMSLEKAIEQVKINTRQYAKRQMTWFRKDTTFQWFDPSNYNELLAFVSK
jgi:tRNA dimethylallyltransferase